MNWSKIKTYFIILLILANLLIIWLLFSDDNIMVKNFDTQAQLIEKMEKDGIILPAEQIHHRKNLEAIIISNRILNLADEKAYYENLGLKSTEEDGSAYLYTLANDGKLTIDYYSETLDEEPGKTELSEDEVFAEAQKYLPEPREDYSYELFNIEYKDGVYEVHFEEKYKDQILPDGYIRISMDGTKLIKLVKRELDATTKGEIKIISYDVALYRLYSSISPEDLPIAFTGVDIIRQMEAIATDAALITADTFAYYRFVSDKGSFLIKAQLED